MDRAGSSLSALRDCSIDSSVRLVNNGQLWPSQSGEEIVSMFHCAFVLESKHVLPRALIEVHVCNKKSYDERTQ